MPTSSEPSGPPGPDDVIVFDSVHKRYRLGSFGGDLRNDVGAWVRRLFGRAPADETGRPTVDALAGVSFRVGRGENVGIVGPNGAGKSTMLKLIAKITRPNRGDIWVRGRVAALIQLGAGFHIELTGRENVFLYGSILGLSHAEIAERYDEIVAFAELADFMDTPVKRYSSGMYVRLGFAVAVHVDADVLLIDEVLAVGDQSFREKCLERMRDYMEGETTMLFVSHDRQLVESVCDRALLIDGGLIVADGPATSVLNEYEAQVMERGRLALDPGARRRSSPRHGRDTATSEAHVSLVEVSLRDDGGRVATEFVEGQPLRVRVEFQANQDCAAIGVGVRIQRGMTLVYETRSADTIDQRPLTAKQRGRAELRLEALQLLEGSYAVSIWLETGALGHTVRLDAVERGLHFRVSSPRARGLGLVSLGPRWRLELDGSDARDVEPGQEPDERGAR